MTTRTWDKLVRDRMPTILAEQGIVASVRVLGEKEYLDALRDKLLEEAHEVRQADDVSDLAVELTDVVEVVYALGEAIGFSQATLEELRRKRARERGGFATRVFLERTEDTKPA